MRISLNGSVCTVKRLRVSLGTLVAIEATGTATADMAASEPAFAGVSATESVTVRIGARATAIARTRTTEVVARKSPPGNIGCEAELAGPAIPDNSVEAAVERAFAAIEQVNRLMHPRAQGSDLSRINSAPLHVPTKVHVSVGQLLNLARRINTLTDGVFDPCTPARPGRLSDIEVSADETEVVCHAPVALDFGGFAKGYAVDCAIEALMAGGCTAGLVNAGGDLRVFGQRTEPLFVRGPGGELITIALTGAALAVSDAKALQRPTEHQGYYVRGLRNTPGGDQDDISARLTTTHAAVIANTAAVADALAKCVLLCPASAVTRVLTAFGATQPLITTAIFKASQA